MAPGKTCTQESEQGHWHIPILSEHDYEAERQWLCITRAKSRVTRQNSETGAKGNFHPNVSFVS